MKKIALVMVLVLTIAIGYAQKNVRQTASNFLKDGKLDKAMEAINQCIQDPTTASDPKAWFIRGNIYLEISNSKDENFKKLDPNALQQALDSYKKANEFDTKKEFYEDIFAKVNWQRNNYFNQAVDSYNKKLYAEAMNSFEKAANSLSILNVGDTLAIFYAAACASLIPDKEKAKQFYIQLLQNKSKTRAVYVSLSDIYRQESDSANALKVVKAGMRLFPGDLQLFLAETSIYLTFNQSDKALRNLKMAIQKDSLNPTVFYALGNIYDKMADDSTKTDAVKEDAFNQAIEAYKHAIRLNPLYFDANFNIGALYVNKAAVINDKANKLPLDAEAQFKALKEEATRLLGLAGPFLEKASEISPNDMNTLYSLKQIYVRTNQLDKLKALNERIDALQKKK